eukprot:CAMPEP_0119407798 /NCGR_PEP_ID=MMETSP1335-20130426/1573_1 /TAXON_ID=259385 /ORGANISM="Chrysoculter rhomboideus, Strain RCC1486" /LENGTH=62 /DNA_ID=CAMNT_0007431955 /DNA_START=342 /DNA_END=533 /DNA_ORIENTATION=-
MATVEPRRRFCGQCGRAQACLRVDPLCGTRRAPAASAAPSPDNRPLRNSSGVRLKAHALALA